MKLAWNRLGSPDAISWVQLLLVSVQLIAGSLFGPFVDITGRVWEFLGIRVIALVFMFIVLGFGKLALLRFASKRPLPALTLVTFAVSTLTGVVSINGLLIEAGFTDRWNIGQRLLVALPGVFTIMVISALFVSFARDFARRNAELAATARELAVASNLSTQRLEEKKTFFIDDVREQIHRALRALNPNNQAFSVDDLKALVDDVVRPMSYALSLGTNADEPRRATLPNVNVPWSEVIEKSVRINPAHPTAVSLWLGGLFAVFFTPIFGLRGLATAIVIAAIWFALLSLARATWHRVTSPLPAWAGATVFSGVVLAVSLLTALVTQMVTGLDFTVVHAIVGWMTLNFFMVWTVTVVYGVYAKLRETSIELERAVAELKRENIRVLNDFREFQKAVSRVLHGPVQEAISASIHRLQSVNEEQTQEEIVVDLQQRIFSSLQDVIQPEQVKIDLDAAVRDLSELWAVVAEIRWEIDPDIGQALSADRATTSALIELIREGCTNAIRHADARNISILVSPSDLPAAIDLTMTNDGKPFASKRTKGLGSRIFDERCLRWSCGQEGRNIVLRASLPITRSLVHEP